jgi:hypothetical protein
MRGPRCPEPLGGKFVRPRDDYERVRPLFDQGLNDCQVARATGIPRATIREWRHKGPPGNYGGDGRGVACPFCHDGDIESSAYAYLLGLYLGDGYIVRQPNKDVYKLCIFLDAHYPGIIRECRVAIGAAFPAARRRVGSVQKEGCVELYSFWKHWPCVFPQYGPGPKHLRLIRLEAWQKWIVTFHPDRLLRGLVHSDGWRGINPVTKQLLDGPKRYRYPRYEFTNNSDDIRRIFCYACKALAVSWTQTHWNRVAVSRREDVAKLDLVIGPKQ